MRLNCQLHWQIHQIVEKWVWNRHWKSKLNDPKFERISSLPWGKEHHKYNIAVKQRLNKILDQRFDETWPFEILSRFKVKKV